MPWQLLLFVIPTLTTAFGLANGSNGLVWRNLHFADLGWIMAMETSGYGPIALATMLQSYVLTLLGAFILLQHSVSTIDFSGYRPLGWWRVYFSP